MARCLGVDYGSVRVGLALSDPTKTIASPWKTIQNSGITALADEICRIVTESDISEIVFGRPFSLSGEDGHIFLEVKELAELISSKINEVKVGFQDERFSSVEAQTVMHEVGESPSRNKAVVDAVAACLILQSYLELNYG